MPLDLKWAYTNLWIYLELRLSNPQILNSIQKPNSSKPSSNYSTTNSARINDQWSMISNENSIKLHEVWNPGLTSSSKRLRKRLLKDNYKVIECDSPLVWHPVQKGPQRDSSNITANWFKFDSPSSWASNPSWNGERSNIWLETATNMVAHKYIGLWYSNPRMCREKYI